jgi:predicted GNAT family acetyltransferase
MTITFTDNVPRKRFEYNVGGLIVFANYRREPATLYIDYVEAPPKLRGTGAAGQLMQRIVDFAQKENLKIVPICGFAALWMKKHTAPPKAAP